MMTIIEYIYIIGFLGLCVLAARSDLKNGVIRNKLLLIFAILAVGLDAIYYGVFVRDLFYLFLLNAIVTSVISLVLFYTHCFAGGDCKLIIVLAILYPASRYLMYGSSRATLFFAIGIAILYGYAYLLISSVWALVNGRNKMTPGHIGQFLLNFVRSFISAMICVTAINLIAIRISSEIIIIPGWMTQFICIGTAIMVGKFSVFKKWFVLIPVLVIDICLCLILGTIPISLHPENYILVTVLLICQMTIRTNLYEEIKIPALKKGMILSMSSSAMVQSSRMKGLPGVSTEDLKSKLTEGEIESVRQWGRNRGVDTVVIVKKIPFAACLAFGFISYYVIWRCLI